MDINHYMGPQSTTFTDWCKEKYGSKCSLRINAEWDSCSATSTRFELNGVSHPYTDFNKDLPVAAGTDVSIILHGDSSAHVHIVDGVDVGYPTDHAIETFAMPAEGKTISVTFTPYWT